MAEAKRNHLHVIDDWEYKTPTGRDERWKFLDVTHGKGVSECDTPDSEYIRILNDERDLPPNRNLQDDDEKLAETFSRSLTVENAAAEIGEMLLETRKASKLSQAKLGGAMGGIAPSSLRRIEGGKTNPTVNTIVSYAESAGFNVQITLKPK